MIPNTRPAQNEEQWWRFPTILFFTSTATALIFSWLAMHLGPDLLGGGGFRDYFLQKTPSLDGLFRWDAGWYLSIATTGYDVNDLHTANIWPGLPLLARALNTLVSLDPHYGLLLVSNLARLCSLLCIYRVFLIVTESVSTARLGLTLFVAYPFHFFQMAAYPESLMCFGSSASLLLALQGRHIRAGLVLGLGAVCRHLTILFGIGLLIQQIRERGFRRFFSVSLVGLIVPFLFPAGFSYFQWKRFGDPLAFWNSRSLWGASAWSSAFTGLSDGFHDQRYLTYFVAFVILVFSLAAGIFSKKLRPLSLSALPLVIVLAVSGQEGLGRYSASIWPAFLPLAVLLNRFPNVQSPVILAFALLQGQFFWLFAHQYPIL
jgi:hypothetical protein